MLTNIVTYYILVTLAWLVVGTEIFENISQASYTLQTTNNLVVNELMKPPHTERHRAESRLLLLKSSFTEIHFHDACQRNFVTSTEGPDQLFWSLV